MLQPALLIEHPSEATQQAGPYPDRWIKLLCIPLWAVFFRHIAEPARLADLLMSPQYYIDILFILLAAVFLWQLNLSIVRWADQRYSWAANTTRRLLVQGGLAYGITAALIVLLSLLYHGFMQLEPHGFNASYLFLSELPVNLLFVTIIHMIYTGLWMIRYHKQSVATLNREIERLEMQALDTKEAESEDAFKQTLLVNQGRGLVPLATAQIACIFTANEASFARTLEGKAFTVDGTLEQLEEQLSPREFFRISRQFIVQRGAIRRVEGESSGRLLLHLPPGNPATVTVSRRRAQLFRQWMEA